MTKKTFEIICASATLAVAALLVLTLVLQSLTFFGVAFLVSIVVLPFFLINEPKYRAITETN